MALTRGRPGRRPNRGLGVTSILVALVLAATACAGDGGAGAASGDADATGPAGAAAADDREGGGNSGDDPGRDEADGAASGDGADPVDTSDGEDRDGDRDSDEELSVLGSFLGYEIPGLDSGDQLALRRIEQDTIERCMREQGFSYIAWVEDPAVVYAPVEEGLDPESREFAATYGFGVSTQFYAQRDVGPGLVGHRGDGSGVTFDENPNDAIRAALSPAELDAYDRAFFGPDSPIFGGPTGGDSAGDGDGGGGDTLPGRELVAHGCIGEAQRAIDGEAGPVLDVFAVEILGLGERAIADERFVAYADGVERCVHEAGYDFYRHRPAWAVLAHFDALVFEFDERIGGNPFERLDEEALAAMSPQEIDALYDLPRDIPDGEKARLGEIQELETAAATAVWDCGGHAAEERRLMAEITADLQAEFIEANREQLEAYRRP